MTMVSEFMSPGRLQVWAQALLLKFSRIRKAIAHRRHLENLLQAEDHLLADIGLTRMDIHHARTSIPAHEVGEFLTKTARNRRHSNPDRAPGRNPAHSAAAGIDRLSSE